MLQILDFLSTEGFQPHGMCLIWRPDVFWTHVVSDVVIVIAYFSIPAALLYLAYKRPDILYRRVLLMFGAFIIACGITHLFGIWTMWVPDYSIEAILKAMAAVISAATAIMLWPLTLKLISSPDTALLKTENSQLALEIQQRRTAELELQKLNHELELRVHERTEELEQANTALREREQVVQRERERFEESLEAIPNGFLLWGSDNECIYANRRFREMRPELVPLLDQGLTAQEFAARAKAERILESGELDLEADREHLRPDGSEWEYQLADGRWIRHVRHKTTEGGRVVVLTDITRLKVERQRLEDSLEAIPNGFHLWGSDGKLLYANRRFFEMRPEMKDILTEDIQIGEFTRKSLDIRFPDATDAQIERTVAKIGVTVDTDEYRAPGGRWLQRSVRPTSEGGSVVILSDVTSLKQAQENLERQAADLQRSNDELEQFAYIASHDLQEPLRMVASYCSLLDKMYSDKLDDEGREFIHYAVDGAKRMRSLIDDLLVFSRAGGGSLARDKVSLSGTLEDAKLALEVLLSETDATIIAGDLPVVMGSSPLLVQVFQNLIGNAIKFRSDDHPKVEISAQRIGDFWEICVADNGIGIDPKYAETVFRMFQRLHTREDYPGNGLGLALCQRIILRHGGSIRVEPSPDQGTVIRFTLPAEHTIVKTTLDEVYNDGRTTG